MAGTVTQSDYDDRLGNQLPVQRVVLAWVSDGSGNVSGILTTKRILGKIARVVFVPGTGSLQPSGSYSVTLLDENGIDLLSGQGASLSNSSATEVAPGCPMKDGTTTTTTWPAINDKLQLTVSGAGSGKAGTVVVYVIA